MSATLLCQIRPTTRNYYLTNTLVVDAQQSAKKCSGMEVGCIVRMQQNPNLTGEKYDGLMTQNACKSLMRAFPGANQRPSLNLMENNVADAQRALELSGRRSDMFSKRTPSMAKLRTGSLRVFAPA
jgi:hypothetical protein